MIEEKDIKEGNKIIGLVNGSVFEMVRIYKNNHGYDYVMLKDIKTNSECEISKKHLKYMLFDLYQQEMKGWDR